MSSKVQVLSLEGQEVESIELPFAFNTPVREDLIKRVYVALESHRKQPQGRDPLAGERTTAESGHPPTGRGIARIPRVKGERYAKSGMAGAVASVVHGRLPHPPRSEKSIRKNVNKKERSLALASAISATASPELVAKRGHKFTASLPIVVSGDIENVSKVIELKNFFGSIGADRDLERVSKRSRKVSSRASTKNRMGVGPLLVVSNNSKLSNVVKSLQGVSVVKSSNLSVLDLAPGSSPGRLTIWTKDALSSLPKTVQRIGAQD